MLLIPMARVAALSDPGYSRAYDFRPEHILRAAGRSQGLIGQDSPGSEADDLPWRASGEFTTYTR